VSSGYAKRGNQAPARESSRSHDSLGHIEFVGAVIDITERKAAEERIREKDAELQQILDLTPQLIAVYGPGRERLYINRIDLITSAYS